MRFGILSPCTYSEKAARLQFYVTKRKEREKTQFLFQTIPNNRTKLARMTIDLSVKTYVKSREKERRTEIHNGWPRMRLKNLTINTEDSFQRKKNHHFLQTTWYDEFTDGTTHQTAIVMARKRRGTYSFVTASSDRR